ncbi:MAG: hypothetical protein IJX87_06275 [Clostridia bacterium]|nr:hypothetical protein [Clostridia bacterium]
MKYEENKNNQNNKNTDKKQSKQEAGLVTKESVSAVGMLFFFIALLVLCTRSLIFGEAGGAIHAFLTGFLGYFAYPLLAGALYLSTFALIGKRLVKNRKAGLCVALICIFTALIVHIACTYRWSLDGYLARCFAAGENFPKATATGWLGGVIVYGLSLLMSKLGAIIFLAVLLGFSIYLTVVAAKRGKKKAVKERATEEEEFDIPFTTPVSQPQAQPQPQSQQIPPMQQTPPQQQAQPQYSPITPQEPFRSPVYGGYNEPKVTQRPGVTFTDTPMPTRQEPMREKTVPQSFSPFGLPQQTETNTKKQDVYANSREFLFGISPQENYKKNLIFDPNANVNKLPPVDPNQPQIEVQQTPSYVDSYQSYVNEREEDLSPKKIVTDAAPSYTNTEDRFDYGDYRQSTQQTPFAQPQTQTGYNDGYASREYSNPYTSGYDRNERKEMPMETPIKPMMPMEEQKPVYPAEPYGAYDESARSPYSFGERTEETYGNDRYGRESYGEKTYGGDRYEQKPNDFDKDVAETVKDEETPEYKRHDYMELFSTSNPNIFGRTEDDEPVYQEVERGLDRSPYVREEVSFDRGAEKEETEPLRDGLHLFDEMPEDNPYMLRSDFEEDMRSSSLPNERERGSSDTQLFAEERGREVAPIEEPFTQSRFVQEPEVAPKSPVSKPVQEPKPVKPRVIKPYVRMRLDDLDCRDIEPTANADEVERTKEDIIATLEDFKVTGATIASVTFGPTVTRYNVTLPRSISPKKVVALDQSVSISLHSSGVNIYPNYEDGVVSIEVPNKERQFVQLGCMLSGDSFVNAKRSSLMFAMGKDVANHKVYGDISKMIHLLVAGASGSGKSVFLGALIISLIYKYSPQELRLILIDPKKTEFVLYNDLPHLMINEIITDVNKAVQSLNWAIEEMNRRYGLFEQMSRSGKYVVNLDQYNEHMKQDERLPKIVIIIDELADLMLAAKKEMEDRIQNLTQKARAAGIHLIVATQRPSTDVITGVIKSNLPTRIAFGVATDVDSRVILDQTGAQKLLGKGDFLYTMQGINTPVRVQSAFISPEESQKVVNFIKANNEAYYDEEATAYINNSKGSSGDSSSRTDKNNVEPVYIDALRYVILSGSASISMIQRKCSAGYNKAGKIIEWMEDMGYISPFDGAKARKVLISKEEFEEKYGPLQ